MKLHTQATKHPVNGKQLVLAAPLSVGPFGLDIQVLSNPKTNRSWLDAAASHVLTTLPEKHGAYQYKVLQTKDGRESRLVLIGDSKAKDSRDRNYVIGASRVRNIRVKKFDKQVSGFEAVEEKFIWRYSRRAFSGTPTQFRPELEKLASKFTAYAYFQWMLTVKTAIVCDSEHTDDGKRLWKRMVTQALRDGRFVYAIPEFPKTVGTGFLPVTTPEEIENGVWSGEYDSQMNSGEKRTWKARRLVISRLPLR